MKIAIICIVLMAFLFALAFVAKKRFGLLVLALAAGSILSEIWGENVSIAANIAGLRSGSETNALVFSLLIILPSLILMFHGYSYRSIIGRFFGALVYVFMSMAFVLQAVGSLLAWGPSEIAYYNLFQANSEYVIGIGLTLAVVDLFLTKPIKKSEKSKEH